MKIFFLIFFIVVMVGVGIYSRSHVKDVNDFFLGGRKMGGWISAFAYGTSYFSAVIFIGYAGKFGWGFGISTVWIGIGNALFGCLFAWLLLAKRTRSMTHALNVSTMPEFFEARYDCKWMKVVCAAIIFVFLVPYSASVYKGLGYIFESAFGVSFELATLIMAILTALYLLLGGYVATAINDFIQGIIMIVGVILMVLLIVNHDMVGGLSSGIKKLSEISTDLIKPFGPAPFKLLGLVFMTSFGAWGLPQMIHKFYAVKDDNAIKKGTIISTIFALIIGGGAYFVGAFGRLFVNNQVPEGNLELVMPKAMEIALPDALMGIIIILILSASMSTLSSLVLVSSSTISIDLIKGFLFPKMDKKSNMILMRVFCTIFVAVSYIIAVVPNATIVALMSLSWGVIAGMFLAPYFYGLWWKGTTKLGAWAGFLSGAITMIVGMAMKNFDLSKVFAPGLASYAMIISIVVVPLVSLFTKKYPEEHLKKLGNI